VPALDVHTKSPGRGGRLIEQEENIRGCTALQLTRSRGCITNSLALLGLGTWPPLRGAMADVEEVGVDQGMEVVVDTPAWSLLKLPPGAILEVCLQGSSVGLGVGAEERWP
jgi:hypothetical protein